MAFRLNIVDAVLMGAMRSTVIAALLFIGVDANLRPVNAQSALSPGCAALNTGVANIDLPNGGPTIPPVGVTNGLVFAEGEVITFNVSQNATATTIDVGGTQVTNAAFNGPRVLNFTITAALAGRPITITIDLLGLGAGASDQTNVNVSCLGDVSTFVETTARVHGRIIGNFLNPTDMPDVERPAVPMPVGDIKDRGMMVGTSEGKQAIRDIRSRIVQLDADYQKLQNGSLSADAFRSRYEGSLSKGRFGFRGINVDDLSSEQIYLAARERETNTLMQLTAQVASGFQHRVAYTPDQQADLSRKTMAASNIAINGDDEKLALRYFSETSQSAIPTRVFARGSAVFLTGDTDGTVGVAQVGLAMGVSDTTTLGIFAIGSSGSIKVETSDVKSDVYTNSIGGGLYAKSRFLAGQINAVGAYLITDNDLSITSQTMVPEKGDYMGSVFYVSAAYEQPFEFTNDVVITPSVGVSYLRTTTDSFTDTRGVIVSSTQADEFSFDFRARAERPIYFSSGILSEVRPWASIGSRLVAHDDGDVIAGTAELFDAQTGVFSIGAGAQFLFYNGAAFGFDVHFDDIASDSENIRTQLRLSIPLGHP